MFTPIGFFAPQGGGGSIITDGLQIYADPNLSTVSYTTGTYEGTISNLIGTGYNITFGNVTANPYNGSSKSFTVGTAAGGQKYFLPNGSNPYGNDASADQGFVDLASPLTVEAWVYFPIGTYTPYYYNYETNIFGVSYKYPNTATKSWLQAYFRRWTDATNRYKFYGIAYRNDAAQQNATANYPLGSTQWNDGQWHLWSLTGTGAGGTLKTYVDGVDQNIDLAIPSGPISDNTTLTYFGGSGGGDYRVFQGGARAGAFRWYNKELTAAEVLNNYNVENGTYGT